MDLSKYILNIFVPYETKTNIFFLNIYLHKNLGCSANFTNSKKMPENKNDHYSRLDFNYKIMKYI